LILLVEKQGQGIMHTLLLVRAQAAMRRVKQTEH
jgi:hypothetical protein